MGKCPLFQSSMKDYGFDTGQHHTITPSWLAENPWHSNSAATSFDEAFSHALGFRQYQGKARIGS